MTKWAYIFEHPGTDPVNDRTVIERDGVTTLLVPVPDPKAAPLTAQGLEGEGVGLIELCGGFSTADAAAVRAAVKDSVAVGHVMFSAESLISGAAYARGAA